MSLKFASRCEVIKSLNQIPNNFMHAFAHGALSNFVILWSSILNYVQVNTNDEELMNLAIVTAQKVELFKSYFANFEEATQTAQEEIQSFFNNISAQFFSDCIGSKGNESPSYKHSRFTPYSSMRPRAVEEKQEPLCHWFLSNLSYPYPTAADKTMFTAQTGMNEKQLMAWFTNHRRRSGWTDALQKYASGNKVSQCVLYFWLKYNAHSCARTE